MPGWGGGSSTRNTEVLQRWGGTGEVSKGNAEVRQGGDGGVGALKHVRWANGVFWAANAEVMHPGEAGESGLPECPQAWVNCAWGQGH